MSADSVWDEVCRDCDYYGDDGGLTLSGGEPLQQAEFSLELLKKARGAGWKTAVETCGSADWRIIEAMIPLTDLWLYDLKCVDQEKHRRLTGRSNRMILEHLQRLDSSGAHIELRCPLIPGENDSPRDLEAIRRMAGKLRNLVGIRAEPYHPFGEDKRMLLGRPRKTERIPDDADCLRYETFFVAMRNELPALRKTP